MTAEAVKKSYGAYYNQFYHQNSIHNKLNSLFTVYNKTKIQLYKKQKYKYFIYSNKIRHDFQ